MNQYNIPRTRLDSKHWCLHSLPVTVLQEVREEEAVSAFSCPGRHSLWWEKPALSTGSAPVSMRETWSLLLYSSVQRQCSGRERHEICKNRGSQREKSSVHYHNCYILYEKTRSSVPRLLTCPAASIYSFTLCFILPSPVYLSFLPPSWYPTCDTPFLWEGKKEQS